MEARHSQRQARRTSPADWRQPHGKYLDPRDCTSSAPCRRWKGQSRNRANPAWPLSEAHFQDRPTAHRLSVTSRRNRQLRFNKSLTYVRLLAGNMDDYVTQQLGLI